MELKITNLKRYNLHLKLVLLIALLYMPIFGHLDAMPLRIWDEARLAINAFEMYVSGNIWVTYFEGTPDMWNTKPPFLIWIQASLMKIFGVSVTVVRLPSAISAFLTCLFLVYFTTKYLKNFWIGFIAATVLVTTNGYIDLHGTRTGDYDATLTFFMTMGSLLAFVYIEKKDIKYLYLFFLSLLLAVFTKAIAGLLFLPPIIVYILIKKEHFLLLKNKHFYIGSFLFIATIASYYFLREKHTSGFINSVWENELGGRYLNTIEGHNHGISFYYDNIIQWQFSEWYLFIPCGILIGLFIKDRSIKNLTIYLSLLCVFYLTIISLAETKLKWYSLPLFPLLSVITAIFIYYIFELLRTNKFFANALSINVLPAIFIFLLFISPYSKIIEKTYKPKELKNEMEFYEITNFLKNADKGKINLHNYYLLYDGYNPHNKFYIILLNNKSVNISYKDWTKLMPGDKAIASQNHIKNYIEANYSYKKQTKGTTIIDYEIINRIQ